MNNSEDIVSGVKDISTDFIIRMEELIPDIPWKQEVKENVFSLLDISKPRIMVYGIYNSGKSTLINAMLREERAQMASRPLTDTVSDYDNGNYILMDAPGVDAPIAHEEVTNAHLNQCHIILFVMSSRGGFESRENYSRLVELIGKNTPFIIVLNERSAGVNSNMTSEEKEKVLFEQAQNIASAKEKIIENLVKISGNKSIIQKYDVVTLDAYKALVGIQKGKPELFDRSNVSLLEQRIDHILHSEEVIKKLFIQPVNNLKDMMRRAEQNIFAKYTHDETGNYEKISELIQQKKEAVFAQLQMEISELLVGAKPILSNNVRQGNQEGLKVAIEEIESDFNLRYLEEMKSFSSYIERKFVAIYSENLKVASVQVTSPDLNFEQEDDALSESSDTESSDVVDDITTIASGAALALPTIAIRTPLPAPIKIPAVVVAAGIQIIGKLLSHGMREQEQQRRIEAENARFNQQAEARALAELRIAQEVEQAVRSLLYQLERQFSSLCRETLGEMVDQVFDSIREREQEDVVLKKEQDEAIQSLHLLQKRLSVLENQIL